MKFFLKLLLFLFSLNASFADEPDWNLLRELVSSEDAKKYSVGLDELGKIVQHNLKNKIDDPNLRKILYDLLDDDREGGRLSGDEYTWPPKITASMLLIKLTRYVQEAKPFEGDNSLPPVDEVVQVATNKKKNAKFRSWYEKKFLGLESDRKSRPSRESKFDDLLQKKLTRRPDQKGESHEGIVEKKKYDFPWVIAGVLLLGILAFLFRTFKGKSTT